ncbi:MAG: DUF2284 domain-containing protein [Butyricicoccus sp.]
MMRNEICRRAKECGFAYAHLLPTGQVPFDPSLRVYCEQNACGNYAKNYACPPHCGAAEQMIQAAMQYPDTLVVQKQYAVEDVCDPQEARRCASDVKQRMWKLIDMLREQNVTGLASMPGECTICPTCGMTEGKPCACPERVASCLSAFCVDATELMARCAFPFSWSSDHISYVCLYFCRMTEGR